MAGHLESAHGAIEVPQEYVVTEEERMRISEWAKPKGKKRKASG